MIWMDVDTALASVPVNSMPLVDSTDFITIEDAVVFNQAGLALFWNFTTTAGVTTVTAVTPTTAGVYDWTDFTTSGMYGIELPASGGASANNDTEGFGHFTGVATGILPWRGPTIGFRAAALNNALVDGGDSLDVNVIEISGDAPAADNLELQYDGTGITGDTFPATQAGVAGIGSGSGSALNFPVTADNTAGAIIDGVTFVGSQTGTFANTLSDFGTFHQITHATNAFDLVYRIACGATFTAVSITVAQYMNSSNDVMNVQVYDHEGAGWDTFVGNFAGTNGTTVQELSVNIFGQHTGTGAEAGNVYVRFVTTAQTAPVLFIAKVSAAAVSSASTGYENGSVWFDSNASNTNTEEGVDGVSTNPVSTMGAVNTLLTSTGLHRVSVSPGSTATFAASQDNEEFSGKSWTLALGGQSIDGSSFSGAAVSGVATNTSGTQYLINCLLGACTFPSDTHLLDCGIGGTQTVGEAGDYFYDKCHSGVAGSGAPVLDFAAVGATNMNFRQYSGGIEVQNMTALDTMSLEGNGQVIFNANCTGGAISIRGNFTITDNAGGAITVTDGARFDVTNEVNANVKTWNDVTVTTALETAADVNTAVEAGQVGIDAAAAVADLANATDGLGAIKTSVDAIPTTPMRGTDNAATAASVAALNDLSAADILTTQLTESYAADGAAPTLTQSLMLIQQVLGDFAISGTTLTVRQVDGSTTAATFTLDDGTNPTAITRAT